MGSLTNNWSKNEGIGLSQKVFGKVKPDAPIKNKIEDAQKKLELQINKLASISEKLQKKHDHIFQKIIQAQKSNNHSYAKAYAIELQEIRKMNNMVSNAKLSMEQINIRLNTVSELGDVVVTLSPCMSIIKGLSPSLNGLMPEANASMQDLSLLLGDVMSGSSLGGADMLNVENHQSADSLAILEEAHAVIAGQTKQSIPDLPDSLKHEIVQRKTTDIFI